MGTGFRKVDLDLLPFHRAHGPVECKGARDAEARHDDATGAVREAPTFVRELPENLPRLLDILASHPV